MYVVGGGSKKTYARFFKKPKLAIFFFFHFAEKSSQFFLKFQSVLSGRGVSRKSALCTLVKIMKTDRLSGLCPLSLK